MKKNEKNICESEQEKMVIMEATAKYIHAYWKKYLAELSGNKNARNSTN